jgi:hypothetical protein
LCTVLGGFFWIFFLPGTGLRKVETERHNLQNPQIRRDNNRQEELLDAQPELRTGAELLLAAKRNAVEEATLLPMERPVGSGRGGDACPVGGHHSGQRESRSISREFVPPLQIYIYSNETRAHPPVRNNLARQSLITFPGHRDLNEAEEKSYYLESEG